MIAFDHSSINQPANRRIILMPVVALGLMLTYHFNPTVTFMPFYYFADLLDSFLPIVIIFNYFRRLYRFGVF